MHMSGIDNPFQELYQQYRRIEKIGEEIRDLLINTKIQKEEWFTIDQVQDYIPGKPAKSTIYKWVANKKIPYFKSGKRLRFKRELIDTWLDKGYAIEDFDPSSLFSTKK